ncbi:MAG: SCP2 sterol-binding domain-containing protein [Candidatus Bathyarchaeia archaeon]
MEEVKLGEGNKLGKVKYATREYFEMLKDAVNRDDAFKSSDFTSTWAYIFKDKITDENLPLTYIISWENGKIVNVREGKPDENVELKFIATYDTWAKIIQGKMNVMSAMMTGKYKIEGPTSKLMKYSQVLSRLTEITKALEA